jgi:acyl-CoA thioester hydrolase
MKGKVHHNCETEGRVTFYDLDPLQIVWHGNYFNYFEDARQSLFAQRGIDLYEFARRTGCYFPIIRTASKHTHPLRYADVFICKATLVEARTRIIVDFEIRIKDSGKICTRGRTEQVTVKAPGMEMLLFVPEEIRAVLVF